METEILFKAQKADGSGWIEGDLLQTEITEIFKDGLIKIHPETVCQFICEIRDMKVFSGDKVIVQGTKRIGLYETEVIKTKFGFTLKENKTVLSESACLVAIREVIGNIHDI